MARGLKIDFEVLHYMRLESYVMKIEQLYLDAINEASQVGSIAKIDTTIPLEFDKYPALKNKMEGIIDTFKLKMGRILSESVKAEWLHACNKSDYLVKQISKNTQLTPKQIAKYSSRNIEALSSFQERKTNGLNLSERVWNYSNQFKGELEMGLDLGLGEGKSASELSRDLRSYLKEPEKLFRRVRDKHGNLQLSKNAQKYNPGTGVYRSSYKNALRLTRTEINMAYRTSDYTKNQQLDFVVGFEVKRSNRYFACSVCESLKGKYPKDFKFVGWHPHCRCFSIAILSTEDEFLKHQNSKLRGENEALESENEIKDLPYGFKSWVNDNKERISAAKKNGTLPYFLKDNDISKYSFENINDSQLNDGIRGILNQKGYSINRKNRIPMESKNHWKWKSNFSLRR